MSHDPTVLIADEDAETRARLGVAFTDAGFATLEANDADGALEAAGAMPLSLVVLSQTLPGPSTIEVLQRLEDCGTHVPVALVADADDPDTWSAGVDLGVVDQFVRPLDPGVAVARIRAHIRVTELWRARLSRMAGHRRAMRAALGHSRSADPATLGPALCNALLELDAVEGAAILRFGHRRVTAVAVEGACSLRVGEVLPEEVASYLRFRAEYGPWIEHVATDLEQLGGESPSAVDTHPVVFAPVAGPRPIGLLAAHISPTGRSLALDASSALAASVDLASLATALLGESLDTLVDLDEQRFDLRRTISGRAFRPHFQPIIDLNRGEIVGWEALTRFSDGTPPDERFAQAASAGLGTELEFATMECALDEARSLPADTWLALNASSELLSSSEPLKVRLDAADRPIVLELSEHNRVDDYGAISDVLEHLGPVRLSVDDAGSGFASLRHVLILRPAFIKLDRSWVTGLERDAARQSLIAGLQRFASATKAILVAEGIETEAELELLRDLGVELGQGFLLGRPEPVSAGRSDTRAEV